MPKLEKVCPIVTRTTRQGTEVLAFQHPTAGKQFVKGGIKPGETPAQAATRELWEESGLTVPSGLRFCCTLALDSGWHIFHGVSHGLPDAWSHQTHDDHGHVFSFFWHTAQMPLDDDWHDKFHHVLRSVRPYLD